MKYALMLNPGHSQVYLKSSEALSMSELAALSSRLSTPLARAAIERIGGAPYLTFQVADRLSPADMALVWRLSFAYAVFEATDDNRHFSPVSRDELPPFPDELSAMLKYGGKTNELFTRFLIHMALAAGDLLHRPDCRLLDPVAGKGTTLYEGLIAGLSVAGVELNKRVAHEAEVFFKKYLENGKYRHSVTRQRVAGENRSFTAEMVRFEVARTKLELKEGAQSLTIVAGDARYADRYFKRGGFDLVVGDLPYGVQHESGAAGASSRSPKALLSECLPAWRNCLAPGGALALSWNLFSLDRRAMCALLEQSGFAVLDEPPYSGLAHRVDQAILRDAVFALKR